MQHFVWVFTVCHSSCLGVSGLQKVKQRIIFLNVCCLTRVQTQDPSIVTHRSRTTYLIYYGQTCLLWCILTHVTVLPAKSYSDVTFVYKVTRDLESIAHLCINHFHRIWLMHKWSIDLRMLKWSVQLLVFYLAIVNKVLRHCHSWLARQ